MSENRHNIFIFARLREKASSSSTAQPFCIANYHMPCAFFAPMVMTIHAEMVAKRTQELAGEDPYILAGDFNILPESSTYTLLTTGELPRNDASYPTSKFGMEWRSTIRGMKSAYAQHPHGEPDFTNYAHIREDENPFIGTLDYIFLSDNWKVRDVTPICHRNDANGPYPNADEPSDHVLISATLEC